MYITFTSAKIVNKAEPTLAMKPRGDVTRNPKQGLVICFNIRVTIGVKAKVLFTVDPIYLLVRSRVSLVIYWSSISY